MKTCSCFGLPIKRVARTLANDHVHEPTQIHKQAQVEIKKLRRKVKVLKETVC